MENRFIIFNAKAIIDRVGLPCFVKANRAGSSFGVTKVHQIEDLQSAIDIAFEHDDELIIESFLDGTEVSVGVLRYKGGVIVLLITEIVSENDFFDYEAKYLGKSEEITPARLSKIQEQNVKKMAKSITIFHRDPNRRGIAVTDLAQAFLLRWIRQTRLFHEDGQGAMFCELC